MILEFEWVGPTFITMMRKVEMKLREPSQIVAVVAMVSITSMLDIVVPHRVMARRRLC